MARVSDLRIDPEPPAQGLPLLGKVLIGAVLLVVAGGALFYAVDRDDSKQDEPTRAVEAIEHGEEQAKLTHVGTQPGAGFQAGGYLEVIPPGPRVVTAMVDGRIEELEVVAGDRVGQGDILLRFDDTLYRQEVALRESEVELAQTRLRWLEAGFRKEEIARAEAELQRAVAARGRAQRELERVQGAVAIGALTVKRRDDAQAELLQSSATVDAHRAEVSIKKQGHRREEIAVARAELGVANVELERARWKVDATVVRAPIDGVVLEVLARPGDWIARGEDGGRAGALVTLFEPTALQAWVDVNQRDIARVRVGQETSIHTDARPDAPMRGRVLRLMPRANLQRNTVEVKVEILEPHEGLRPDMAVRVQFTE